MALFDGILWLSAFFCSLVAGLLFAFAIVVMPGIAKLDDRAFLRAFQAIDGVIQNNQPIFMVVWVGSALAVLVASVLGTDRVLVLAAAAIYLAGVQAPTIVVNVPLNNRLKKLDPDTMSEAERKRARSEFEPAWNRSNAVRTVCACLASALLLVVLLRK